MVPYNFLDTYKCGDIQKTYHRKYTFNVDRGEKKKVFFCYHQKMRKVINRNEQ